ncbi:hypothetical protein TESG_08615 [Trichophyton tonsurans CBS 112818]|uniref:Uncharacterized protein n=1 Tax=Trichophyton tonsurans (strain CBS 112818) TaxID=647933 RepID=F2S8G5_TRIT1|nr:hypothetical protein TESG_08615 [Trichophyton tonsurans CBS 112818]
MTAATVSNQRSGETELHACMHCITRAVTDGDSTASDGGHSAALDPNRQQTRPAQRTAGSGGRPRARGTGITRTVMTVPGQKGAAPPSVTYRPA